jgi:hypothetical protein
MKDPGRPGRTRRAQPHRYTHVNAPKQRATLSGGGGNEGVPPKPRPLLRVLGRRRRGGGLAIGAPGHGSIAPRVPREQPRSVARRPP